MTTSLPTARLGWTDMLRVRIGIAEPYSDADPSAPEALVAIAVGSAGVWRLAAVPVGRVAAGGYGG